MTVKIGDYTPMGIDYRQEMKWICIGLCISTLYSFGFLFSLSNYYHALFTTINQKRVLIKGAFMPDFVEVLGQHLIGFFIVSLCMIALVIYHYFYHYQDSKSIYLMRRLPNRWALLKRCVSLPLFSVLTAILMALFLLLFYFGIYFWVTPEACMTPNQWHKLWHIYLGV
ncbi:hypothetical protein [Fusibacter sp. 3D3]|uniref:hypothetical protein n=1 Tax=Fusibacter sp. 3D3 TaxID=1048380 RepID=UPI00085337CF|nr:hypothetical protein [Fusibacter sp. 3D3]GAU78363.1 hypothetical protein F3D3_2996 [Fusibacter sp. 3D3]